VLRNKNPDFVDVVKYTKPKLHRVVLVRDFF